MLDAQARQGGSRTGRTSSRAAGDAAVSDVIATMLLLGIAVVVAGAFVVLLFGLPAPRSQVNLQLQAFVLPTDPTSLLIEDRGGPTTPLRSLQVQLLINGASTSVNVGSALAAGDPKWSVLSPAGSPKTASDNLEPGDQIKFTDSSLRGSDLRVDVVDQGRGVSALSGIQAQLPDATAPRPTSARTVTSTTLQVNFSEPLASIATADFTVTSPAKTISAINLLGDGSAAEFVLSAALAASDTPVVTSVASPTGTKDLANNNLQGNVAVTSADGLAPTLSSVSAGTPGSATATITWTSDEASGSVVNYGLDATYGLTASAAGTTTSHSVVLTNLVAGATYHVSVSGADAAGNNASSTDATFATAPSSASGLQLTGTGITMHVPGGPNMQTATTKYALGGVVYNAGSTSITVTDVHLYAESAQANPFATVTSAGAVPTGCTWSISASGVDLHCTLAASVTIPANSASDFLANVSLAKNGQWAAQLYMVATLSSGGPLVSPRYLVEVTASASAPEIAAALVPNLSSPLERLTDTATAGAVKTFTLRVEEGGNQVNLPVGTHIQVRIPPGWTNLTSDTSATGQPNAASFAVRMVPPTSSAPGYLDLVVSTAITKNTGKNYAFNVTAPATPNTLFLFTITTDPGGSGSTAANDFLNGISEAILRVT